MNIIQFLLDRTLDLRTCDMDLRLTGIRAQN